MMKNPGERADGKITVHILRGTEIDTLLVDRVSVNASGKELLIEKDGEEVGRYSLSKIDGWLLDVAWAPETMT